MALWGLSRGVSGDAWLVSFNNSQRIKYMASLGVPQSHPGGGLAGVLQ